MNITVYLGANEGNDHDLKNAVRELGTLEEITEVMSRNALGQIDAPRLFHYLPISARMSAS